MIDLYFRIALLLVTGTVLAIQKRWLAWVVIILSTVINILLHQHSPVTDIVRTINSILFCYVLIRRK